MKTDCTAAQPSTDGFPAWITPSMVSGLEEEMDARTEPDFPSYDGDLDPCSWFDETEIPF